MTTDTANQETPAERKRRLAREHYWRYKATYQKHRKESWARHKATRPPTVERVCAQCGVTFQCSYEGSRKRKYCSQLCLSRSKYAAHNEWYAKHREEVREKVREYHAAHAEEHRQRSRDYYHANREEIAQKNKVKFQRTRQETPWFLPLVGAKSRAKKKGLPFDLTDEWAQARWTGKCELTDLPFSLMNAAPGPRMFSPTIDRIDPKLGYVQSNCRFLIHAVNALKGEGTDLDALEIGRAIVKNSERFQ